MIVQMQKRDSGVTELKIGARNALRFIPRNLSRVELHLDHLQIECDLKPGSWKNELLISDPRLSAWLEQKHRFRGQAGGVSVFEMTPVEERAFRLHLVSVTTIKPEAARASGD